jgi:hypothetical protein
MKKLAMILSVSFLVSFLVLPYADAWRRGPHWRHHRYHHRYHPKPPKPCTSHPCYPKKLSDCQTKCTNKYGADAVKCEGKAPNKRTKCVKKHNECRDKCRAKYY